MVHVTAQWGLAIAWILAVFIAPVFAQNNTGSTVAVELAPRGSSAESEFREQELLLTAQLRIDPENRAISRLLGIAILNQRISTRFLEGMFHLTRAAFYDGPGALPVDIRGNRRDWVRNTLMAFYGSSEGIVAFIDGSQDAPFPHPDEIAGAVRYIGPIVTERFRGDPKTFLWTSVKNQLLSSTGADYWQTLKGSGLPKLKGTVVRIIRRRQRIVGVEIAVLDNRTTEIVLQISRGINSKWAVGQQVEFDSAVAVAWRRSPTFLLTCQVNASDLYWEAVR